MVKNSFCVSQYETVTPLTFSIVFNEILYLSFQIVGLTRICRKVFQHGRSDFITDSIREY